MATGVTFEKVNSLPITFVANTIYLLDNGDDTTSIYVARNDGATAYPANNPDQVRATVNKYTTLTYASPTLAWSPSEGSIFNVVLAGATTLLPNPGVTLPATYTFIIRQDAAGSRGITFGTSFKFASGAPYTPSTAPDAIDVLTFVMDGAGLLFCTGIVNNLL